MLLLLMVLIVRNYCRVFIELEGSTINSSDLVDDLDRLLVVSVGDEPSGRLWHEPNDERVCCSGQHRQHDHDLVLISPNKEPVANKDDHRKHIIAECHTAHDR